MGLPELPIKITGEISKEETGLLAIVIVMAIATAYMFGVDKNSFWVTVFGFTTFMLTFIFVGLVVVGKNDYLSNLRGNLMRIELLYKLMPLSANKDVLISAYEQLYFRALKEKDNELAEALKIKIEDLKKGGTI